MKLLKENLSGILKIKLFSQRARFYLGLGKRFEAAKDYIRTAFESLKENNPFSAAYYLKEMIEEGLDKELFIEALKLGKKNDDLWLQVRALEELGWESELYDLVEMNAEEVEKSDNLHLLKILAEARGKEKESIEFFKDYIRSLHTVGPGVVGTIIKDTVANNPSKEGEP